MMMTATAAFTAVATPHALVLTVSHDLLFRQPPFAAALMPPFLFIDSLFSRTHCSQAYRSHHASLPPPIHCGESSASAFA
jgi:hypothetical protein